MSGTPYGNRGMTFESLIEYSNQRYKTTGAAIVTKQHTHFIPIRNSAGSVVNCKVEEKATVDYMGRFGEIPIAFEAKHCSTDKIDLKRVEQHQCEFLQDWTKDQTAIGFILISFRFEDYYIIPWEYWKAAVTARENKKTNQLACYKPMGTLWTATGKASIRKDELPEAWKVTSGGAAALDYLQTVRKLWGIEE